MSLSIVLVIGGLALLTVGGELLIRGATAIAERFGVSPAVVGLTVVAAGTSMPELVVSVQAALSGSAELAMANVVGSNIFNIGAILGVAALIAPLRIAGNAVRLEWPLMFLSSLLLFLLARDGSVDRLEGAFFVTALVLFIAYTVKIARSDMRPAERDQFASTVDDIPLRGVAEDSLPATAAFVLAGCGLLASGAHVLVLGATEIATGLGVSETVIGLTIVSAGTSFPELAASVVASYRGRDDIAVANVIGSNIFNVLGIVGITSLLQPLAVPEVLLERDALFMIGLSILLFPLMRSGMRVSRVEGGVLLAAFSAYLVVLLAAA